MYRAFLWVLFATLVTIAVPPIAMTILFVGVAVICVVGLLAFARGCHYPWR